MGDTHVGLNTDWGEEYNATNKDANRPDWMEHLGADRPSHLEIPCYNCGTYHKVYLAAQWTCPSCGSGHARAYNVGYYAGAVVKPIRKVRKAITVKDLFAKARGRLKLE